jgi:hypothetical protein
MPSMGESVADDRGTGRGTGEDWGDYRDRFYSVPEAAKIIGITEGRIRQLARAGKLEGEQPEGYWKLYRYSVHDYRDRKREQEGPSEATEGTHEAREWIERVTTLERELGRLEGRLELTEKTESTMREERERLLSDLGRERERADQLEGAQEEARRLREELEAERSKGFWRRLFGG